MAKGIKTKRKGLRGDKVAGVKARAKAKTAVKHAKYMDKHATGKPKKTAKIDSRTKIKETKTDGEKT